MVGVDQSLHLAIITSENLMSTKLRAKEFFLTLSLVVYMQESFLKISTMVKEENGMVQSIKLLTAMAKTPSKIMMEVVIMSFHLIREQKN